MDNWRPLSSTSTERSTAPWLPYRRAAAALPGRPAAECRRPAVDGFDGRWKDVWISHIIHEIANDPQTRDLADFVS